MSVLKRVDDDSQHFGSQSPRMREGRLKSGIELLLLTLEVGTANYIQ